MKLSLVLTFFCLVFGNFAKAEGESRADSKSDKNSNNKVNLLKIKQSNLESLCFKFYGNSLQTQKLVRKNYLLGFELVSTDPFGLSQKPDFSVFVIKKLPRSFIRRSRIKWLQDEKSYSFVKQLISDSVPIVVGELNQSIQAEAFVIGADVYPLARDFFQAEPSSRYSHLIFITTTTPVSVIEHEVQHWRDRENGTLNQIKARLMEWNTNAKVNPRVLEKIFTSIDEVRGYGREEIALRSENNLTRIEILVREFNEFYGFGLRQILSDIRKKNVKQYEELLIIFKEFELSEVVSLKISNHK